MTQARTAEMVVDRDVFIPMRDGVRLQADIYRPATPGRYPVLVTRSPYGRGGGATAGAYWVPHSYVVVSQDCRGRFGSEGEYYPLVNEGADGYDTVEWAAAQPWSNGSVGTIGQSYLAADQHLLAPEAPPHLRAMVPISASSDFHQSWVYHTGGAFELGWMVSYAIFKGRNTAERLGLSREALDTLDAYVAPAVNFARPLTDDWYRHLPLSDWGERLAAIAPYFADYLAHPDDGPYWWPLNLRRRYHQVDVPMYHMGSWYDIFQEGAWQNFAGIRALGTERARRAQKLLMGPWGHLFPYTQPTTKGTGEIDFGPEAAIDLREEQRRWFDYWLKGIDTGIMDEPPVRIFVMGENRWRAEQEWPPARVRFTPYYLHSGGGARTLGGDGRLSQDLPTREPPDTYVYDPRDPVPTLGGSTLVLPLGVFDQRPVELRPDVLVYTTDVLRQDVEATGPITVTLFAASSAYDTDFTAKLVDVRPDGYAQNIQDGIIRARYRDSAADPSLITPGQVYRYTIDLWATSHVFLAGHRIRLEISSSNFPRFDRNPNTGRTIATETELLPARQTIYHDARYPSHITLPIVPR
jgi:putative CocE/NonD family hydrolase